MSAPASGHGKTAIAVGLLAAIAARGIPAAGFKVGPDHTDAAYLGLAAGRPGRNLDPRLVGAQRVGPLFAHGAAGTQLAVVEGAMGLFDSLTGQPEVDGTAAVAAALRAPVVLVIDVAAMGHSLAALVHGFRMFDEMVHLGGVILNKVASARHEQMLRSAMDDIGMPVLGALHRGELPNVLPARAHGLVPVAHRTVEAGRAVRRLGEAVATMLDMDRLMALAGSAPALPGPIWTPSEAVGALDGSDQRPIIALAGGQGAPYTYVETAELLAAAGADVAVVDPLRDESLPPGTRGLIVGAGLPEGYAEELSANHRLSAAVAQFARDGWPVVAEGIAFPWLTRELDGRPMCGVLDATAATGEQTVAGYREATAPGTSVLAPAGARITGYKQHRAIVAPRAGSAPAWTWSGGNPEGFVWRQVHASQLGLHWAAAPEIARRVVAAALAGPGQPGGPAGSAPSAPQAMSSSSSQSMPAGSAPSGPPQSMPSGPPQSVPSGPSQPMPSGPPQPMPSGPPQPMPSNPAQSMPQGPSHAMPPGGGQPLQPVGSQGMPPMGPQPGNGPAGPVPPMPPVPMPPVPMPPGSMPPVSMPPGSMPQGPMMPGSMPPGPMMPGPLPASAGPAMQHSPGPVMHPGSGPGMAVPQTSGPGMGVPQTSGPGMPGSHMHGPHMTGQQMTGQQMTGQQMAGPGMAPPLNQGPHQGPHPTPNQGPGAPSNPENRPTADIPIHS
ncbi:cobyrinate a,c-diamide synthase [Actinoplanes missouriensis]|uniref:cobyrinate a,c-diamide synthase n=1 Tax=Actinoplanes missouriensis TaxID=1866 RepID=UPI0033C2FE71